MDMSKGLTIYFMRHGETYLNHYRRMQGWSDAPLTKKGEEEVKRSARGLADVEFAAVYSSDLRRAFKTAEFVLKFNHKTDSSVNIQLRSEFREQFFGSYEGLPAIEIWDKVQAMVTQSSVGNPNESVRKMIDTFHALDPYGDAEDFMTFWTRVEFGLIDVVTKHRESDKNILIVSHGLTIRNMLHELIPDFAIDTPLENASISIVTYENGQYHLKVFNQTDHFA